MFYAITCLVILQTCPVLPALITLNGINEFSFRLLENVASENDGNFVVSGASVWKIFALLSEAASGHTFDELMLQLNLPKNTVQTKELYAIAEEALSRNYTGVNIKRLESIYVDMKFKVHTDFIDSASRTHNAVVREVDTTNLQNVADVINYDVCVTTDGFITDVVTKDTLENLKMILIDTVYFNASWTKAFDADQTKEAPFYDDRGRKIGTVNMMYQKAKNNIAYIEEISATVLEITYGPNKKYSFLFIVPFQGTSAKRLMKNLSTYPIKDIFYNLRKYNRNEHSASEIECYVPRFKINSDLDLKQPLKYMGVNEIFEQSLASLPGISDSPLFVSKVLQKAVIEVTESGTVAAGSTVIGLEDRIMGTSVEVNKPFIYMIVERGTDLILFSGVYSVPSLV